MKASKSSLTAAALVLLSVTGWASDKMKAKIQIDQSVFVGATQLTPGEYKMSWTESGPNAEVTFSQGNKVIATVPAQVAQVRSGYPGPALHTDIASHALTEVELPKVSFSFTAENVVPATSGH